MGKNLRKELVLLLLVVFWLLAVLGGYYLYHKPVQSAALIAVGEALLDLGFLILFAGLAGAIGQRLLHADEKASFDRAVLQFALGAGVLSFLWFALGWLGLVSFPVSVGVLLLGWLLLWRNALGWFRQFRRAKAIWKQCDWFGKTLAGITGLLLLYQLCLALAPAYQWDALTYHLQIPRQYLAAGRIFFIPENPYWGHPQLVEMLYTFAMAFHRTQTAAVLGWGVGVLFLLGLFDLTQSQQTGSPEESAASGSVARRTITAGWVTITAVMAGFTFRSLLSWSYTDLFSALFGLAAISTFFAWLDQRQPRWFLWTGLFCGLALGTKWTAGLLPVGLFLAALLYRKSRALSFGQWLLAGWILILTVSPWLLKNWIFTGSPLFPYFWPTPWVDAARLAAANRPLETAALWQNLLAPLASTWTGIEGAVGFSADLGPLLLLFCVPGLWRQRRTPQALSLIILLVLAWIALAFGSLKFEYLMQTRIYYALLPAFAIPVGWGWDWLSDQVLYQVRLKRIFTNMILLVMAFVLWQDSILFEQLSPQKYILGIQSATDYRENIFGPAEQAMQKLNALPKENRILMLWEPRGLYAPLNAQADLWVDRWHTDRVTDHTAAAILKHWKQEGYSHVLIYRLGIDQFIRPVSEEAPSEDWTVFQDLLTMLPKPIEIGDQYWLFSLP
jgi:hypothetical protein